jgi:hypothetical protein
MTDKRFEEKAAELLLWLGVNDNDCHKWTEPPIQHISTALAAVWNEAIEEAANYVETRNRPALMNPDVLAHLAYNIRALLAGSGEKKHD